MSFLGTEATGTNCLLDEHKCSSCDTGFIPDANLCVPKQCTCANGEGNVGTSCATNGTESCALCNQGYHYVNDPNTGTVGCIPNVCTCDGGPPRSGENCTVDGAKQCVCTSAEYGVLSGNDITCETKQCTCPGGTGATGDNCPENGFEYCDSCYGNRKLSVNNWCTLCQPGYYSDNSAPMRCVENQCTCSNGVGNTGAACATNNTASARMETYVTKRMCAFVQMARLLPFQLVPVTVRRFVRPVI